MQVKSNSISCVLGEEESKQIEYYYFKYTAIKNLLNSFILSDFLEYNEDNYNKILSTYVDVYVELQKLIIGILEKNEHMKIPLNNFDYIYSQNQLVVTY